MEYRILNYNLFTDEKGKKQLFLYVEIQNNGDIWRKAERCSPDDVALVEQDETNINDVAKRFAERCVLYRPKELVDEEHRKQVEIAKANANEKINQLVTEVEKLKTDMKELKSKVK